LFESRDVLRSAKREQAPDIGDPKRRIDLAQARGGLLCLIESPGEGMAGRSHARCASVIWLLQESLVRPRRGLVIATSEEMTAANTTCGLGRKRRRIDPRGVGPAGNGAMGARMA